MISLLCNYMMNKSNLERFIKNLTLFDLLAENFYQRIFIFQMKILYRQKYDF